MHPGQHFRILLERRIDFPSSCQFHICIHAKGSSLFHRDEQGSLRHTPETLPCKWWFPFILVLKKPCFNWLQNGDLLRSPDECNSFLLKSAGEDRPIIPMTGSRRWSPHHLGLEGSRTRRSRYCAPLRLPPSTAVNWLGELWAICKGRFAKGEALSECSSWPKSHIVLGF